MLVPDLVVWVDETLSADCGRPQRHVSSTRGVSLILAGLIVTEPS